MRLIRLCVLYILFCSSGSLKAQTVPTTLMHTGTVTDCRSFFYDDGGPTSPYNQINPGGATYTLNIVTGNPVITMTFSPTSPISPMIALGDFIRFHDGFPATPGNQIAGPFTNVPVSGAIPTVTSSTGTLVVVWSEDGLSVGNGWNGGWFSSAPPPIPPTTSINAVPSCSSTVITMTTSEGVLCDSLKANYFNITGPVFPVISTIVPTPCSSGTCNVFQIYLNAPGLSQNCNYSINSTLFRKDKCDSIYKYQNLITNFSIVTCPITGSINVAATNTVCAYSCTANVRAVVPASVCLTLTYDWDNGLASGPGPHPVCPTITTVYNCTVTETSSSNSVVITRTIHVVDPQFGPIASTTVCQNSGSFLLPATPPGGNWFGPGTNSLSGSFSTFQSPGIKTVTYQVGSCFTTTQITIIAGSAGNDDAACLNGPSFTVTGGTPGGGTWSGPHITPTGVFTPTQVGTFIVTYSVGSCSDTKVVTVTNAITVPTVAIDICKSQWFTYLYLPQYSVTPFGGRYSCTTPGAIINNVYGTFSATAAGPGTHIVTYSLASGCSATFAVNVLDIYVTPSTATTCPSKAPFLLSTFPSTAIPAGGSWSCSVIGAIQNSTTGMYNPSAGGVNNHNDFLVYKALNGCPDTILMRCIRTNIVIDSLFFCTSSNTLQLTNSFATFSYAPSGGIYSGPGVSFAGGNYIFNPSTAGPGVHTIKYDMNTCTDSIKMIVYPAVVTVPDLTVCSTHPTLSLVTPPLPFGTNWTGGPGLITPSLGIMNPGAVLAGNQYTYTFVNRAGCGTGSAKVYVYQFIPSSISNLASVYCYKNTTYTFNTAPPNGTLIAVSTITPNTFNPSVVGAGQYTITYEYGIGACLTSTSVVVRVHPQLTTTASVSAPTICLGQSSILNVKGAGGLPTVTQYTYNWTNNLTQQNTHNVVPIITTVYTCVTIDGCSDPVIDTFRVFVYPSYYPAFVTPVKQCYGVAAQVTTNITPSTGPYTYTWNTTPVQNGSVLSGLAGKNYILKIKNTATGCAKDTSIVIPGYNAIKALFSPNPNLSCVPFEESNIAFLDLSNGATGGTWNFNGTSQPYTPGQTVSHEFTNPGSYNVTLNAVNEGNCPSSYAMSICILESTEIFLPDIFSPNNDGANDVLYLRGNGVKEMLFQIYDRWGNKVFESTNVKDGWDGTYKGKDAEPGVYAYYLNVTMFTDKKLVQKGDITLVR